MVHYKVFKNYTDDYKEKKSQYNQVPFAMASMKGCHEKGRLPSLTCACVCVCVCVCVCMCVCVCVCVCDMHACMHGDRDRETEEGREEGKEEGKEEGREEGRAGRHQKSVFPTTVKNPQNPPPPTFQVLLSSLIPYMHTYLLQS